MNSVDLYPLPTLIEAWLDCYVVTRRIYRKDRLFLLKGMRPFNAKILKESLPHPWKDGKFHLFRFIGKKELSLLRHGKRVENNHCFEKDHASISRGICFFTGQDIDSLSAWIDHLSGIVDDYALVEVIVDYDGLKKFNLSCGTYSAEFRDLSENYSTQIYCELCCDQYGSDMGTVIRFAKIGKADLYCGRDILNLKWHTIK